MIWGHNAQVEYWSRPKRKYFGLEIIQNSRWSNFQKGKSQIIHLLTSTKDVQIRCTQVFQISLCNLEFLFSFISLYHQNFWNQWYWARKIFVFLVKIPLPCDEYFLSNYCYFYTYLFHCKMVRVLIDPVSQALTINSKVFYEVDIVG